MIEAMSNTTGKMSVLVSYLERNKRIEIPQDKPRGMTDVQYIESVFKSVFSFDRNVTSHTKNFKNEKR